MMIILKRQRERKAWWFSISLNIRHWHLHRSTECGFTVIQVGPFCLETERDEL